MKFLFLCAPRRLEPLWRSGPYSRHKDLDAADDGYAAALSRYCEPFWERRKVQSAQGAGKMDVVVVGIGVLFFALSLAYVKACDRI
ncbi:hypothetical protein FJ967_32535 [Mesorhizobium sp. B2-3-4]|nr:hypothetical protein FJ967_32535 [Mesorhizobium sp. B2-3-4]